MAQGLTHLVAQVYGVRDRQENMMTRPLTDTERDTFEHLTSGQVGNLLLVQADIEVNGRTIETAAIAAFESYEEDGAAVVGVRPVAILLDSDGALFELIRDPGEGDEDDDETDQPTSDAPERVSSDRHALGGEKGCGCGVIPTDYPVQPITPDTGERPTTCGTCHLTWDDAVVTALTPAPSARCPFENFHDRLGAR